MSMFKNHLLTLAEPGSDGGAGGGGEPPDSGVPPLPSVSARERIYDHADASPNSGIEGAEAPPAPAADPAKPPGTPDSAKAGEAIPDPDKGKATPDPVAEKRVKDAQAALHIQTQENARLKKEKAESDAKLAKVGKYVDFDKLEDHDRTESEKELDQPVTKRDLEALKPPAPAPESTDPLTAEERLSFLSDFYEKNPHVKPFAENKMAYGVFLAEAERLAPETAGKSPLEQLQIVGASVSAFFRNFDATKEKEIAERLNTKRANISAGSLPGSGGAPGTGEAEDEGDDPGAEIAHRNAIRNRALRPTL
jgi:hypothetical protein